MNSTQFYGTHTAMVTPLLKDQICYQDIDKLVDFQIESGISGLVAVGTTGESPTLSHSEHVEVVRAMVQAADKRVPVIAGAGSNSTAEAVELTQKCAAAGADALLHVTPYYNKPSQEGLFRHLSAVAEATDKPIILYSIPGRCIIEFAVDTCARLYEKYPHVLGIKESGGSNDKVDELRRKLGPDYLILSGEDENTLPYMTLGCQGVISVASNIWAKELVQMVTHARNNNFAAAMEVNLRLRAVFKNIFLEPNPVPIKYLMAQLDMISSAEVRLPLCELAAATKTILDAMLKEMQMK